MRRKADGWVNATHILKVANFEKPQRTRILEREVQKGIHEKVQGGYGRYQGTWVPVEAARRIADQYHILDDLVDLFDYVESPDNPPPLVKTILSAAKTEAKAKAKIKTVASPTSNLRLSRLQKPETGTTIPQTSSEMEPFQETTKNTTCRPRTSLTASKKASNLHADPVSTEKKNSPGVPSSGSKRRRGRPKGVPNKKKRLSSFDNTSQPQKPSTSKAKRCTRTKSPPLPTSRQLSISNHRLDPVNDSKPGIDSASFTDESSSISDNCLSDMENNIDAPAPGEGPCKSTVRTSPSRKTYLTTLSIPSKKLLCSQKSGQEILDTSSFLSTSMDSKSKFTDAPKLQMHYNENNDLIPKAPIHNDQNSSNMSTDCLVYGAEDLVSKYSSQILDKLIMRQHEDDEISEESILPPPGLDINHAIDEDGHTVFHWACSLGAPSVVNVLLKHGADIRATNLLGQTPLMRSIMFKNNFDLRTFSKVLEVLRETIWAKDYSGKTVLHHISDCASQKSKRSAAKYYNALLLAKLAETASCDEMKKIINISDNHGDTALHIAAKAGATKIFKELMRFGGDDTLLNANNIAPRTYIRQYQAEKQQHNLLAHSYHNSKSVFRSNTSIQILSNGNGINTASLTPKSSKVYQTYTDHSYSTLFTTPSTTEIKDTTIHQAQIPHSCILNGATPTQSNIRDTPSSRIYSSMPNSSILTGINDSSLISSTSGDTSIGSGIISSSTPTSSTSKTFVPFGIFQNVISEDKVLFNRPLTGEQNLQLKPNLSIPNTLSMASQGLGLRKSASLEELLDGQASLGQISSNSRSPINTNSDTLTKNHHLENNQPQLQLSDRFGEEKKICLPAPIKLADHTTFAYLPPAQSILVNCASELEHNLTQIARINSQEILDAARFLEQINTRLVDIEKDKKEKLGVIAEKLKDLDIDVDQDKWEQEEWEDHEHYNHPENMDGKESSKYRELVERGPYSKIIFSEMDDLNLSIKDGETRLFRLLERSQARDVAQRVQNEEALVIADIRQELNNIVPVKSDLKTEDLDIETSFENIDIETIDLLLDLHLLQHRRKSIVKQTVSLWEDVIPDDKRNNAYRRLIAKACAVPEYQIDKDLLESIIRMLLSSEENVNTNKLNDLFSLGVATSEEGISVSTSVDNGKEVEVS